MKLRAEKSVEDLSAGLAITLAQLRKLRGFDAKQVLGAKLAVIEEYFRKQGLSGAVLGVSGGVDSAVAAALLDRVCRRNSGGLKRLELFCLPAQNDSGVTRQDEAVRLSTLVGASLGRTVHVIDMGAALQPMRALLSDEIGIAHQAWSAGQAVSYLRTPMFYQLATLLTQEGTPSLVIGTINRDEGAYLGYVGKAGDGMVDLQILADLHKSEVRALAIELGVPGEILAATPSADMFDQCADTDVFGAPYDGVELLLLSKSLVRVDEWEAMTATWSEADRDCWDRVCANLETLHGYNLHKYLVGSPAVHLDVLDSAVPGGWRTAAPAAQGNIDTRVSMRSAVRALQGGDRREWVNATSADTAPPKDQDALRVVVPKLLTSGGVESLLGQLDDENWQQSNKHGQWQREKARGLGNAVSSGSWRTTFEDQALANALWEKLRHHLPNFRLQGPRSRAGFADGAVWRPIGVASVFRAIRYFPGETLVAHYDGPYRFDDRRQTGMSLLIYLEGSGEQGGALRFLRDPQAQHTEDACEFEDWQRVGHVEEVEQRLAFNGGDACVFDHHQLHDSEPLTAGRKTLLRTDIMFERVGP